MSGHSKWHTIKHKKGAADAKRGKVFTRIIKELTVAARNGGGDPDSNPRLRTIIAEAKSVNMPADNIKRAIQRGTGELPGVNYEEITYEAYGPGGAAIMIEVADRQQEPHGRRDAPHARQARRQPRRGQQRRLDVRKEGLHRRRQEQAADEEKLLAAAIDAGADDMGDDGDNWEVVSAPEAYQAVLEAVKGLGIEPAAAEVALLPKNYIKLEGKAAQQMIKLMEILEEHEDTKKVWTNADIEEKEIEASLA